MTPVELEMSTENGTQWNGDKKRAADCSDEKLTRKMSTVQDRGWAWVVILSVFMIHFIYDGISYSSGIVLSAIREYFDTGRTEMGWMASIFFYVMYGTASVHGSLIGRFNYRRTGVVASLLAGVFLMLSALAPSIHVLFFTYALGLGGSFGLLYMSALTPIGEYFDKKICLATGLALCGSGCGTVAFAPLTRFLLDTYGWRGTLCLQGALVLHCTACAALLRPAILVTREDQQNKQLTSNMENYSLKRNLLLLRQLGRRLPFILAVTAGFLKTFSSYVTYIFLPDIVVLQGHTPNQAALVISAMSFSNTLSRALLTWIGDTKYISKLILSSVSIILTGIAVLPLPLLVSYYGILLTAVLFGICRGVDVTSGYVVIVDLFGNEFINHTWGFYMTLTELVTLFGPALAGMMYDKTQSYTVSFILFGLLAVVGGLFRLSICLTKDYKEGRKLTIRNGAEITEMKNELNLLTDDIAGCRE